MSILNVGLCCLLMKKLIAEFVFSYVYFTMLFSSFTNFLDCLKMEPTVSELSFRIHNGNIIWAWFKTCVVNQTCVLKTKAQIGVVFRHPTQYILFYLGDYCLHGELSEKININDWFIKAGFDWVPLTIKIFFSDIMKNKHGQNKSLWPSQIVIMFFS